LNLAQHFPDRVSAAIDEERRAYFAQPGAAYQSRCVLCVTYMPPSGSPALREDDGLIYRLVESVRQMQ